MEAVGQLAGGIAHDFNNLLTSIMGYTEFALDALPDDSPVYSDLLGIQKSAQRAADLTSQLLAFARKQIVQPKTFNLNNLIVDMDGMLRRLIRENIEFKTLPAPDLGLVRVDPNQIELVLVNLVVNACDAMPDGGILTIETANVTLDEEYVQRHAEVIPGEYIMVCVTDSGSGMTPDIRLRVFEPFFTTKEVGEGTGLGLATCFGIVKQSEGHIWVYSEPDQGTAFKVYLPRVQDERPSRTRTRFAEDLPRGTETVLVVEDEAIVRSLAVRTLRLQGYTVLEASNGQVALNLIQTYAEGKIDLLITDVIMPQMGGKELVEQLKELYQDADFKVLFISGYPGRAVIRQGILALGDAYLQKPFVPDTLARKVREVLDAPD